MPAEPLDIKVGKLYELMGFGSSNTVLALRKGSGLFYLLLNDLKPNVTLVLGTKHYKNVMLGTPGYTAYTVTSKFQSWIQILYNDEIYYVSKSSLKEISNHELANW